MSVEKLTAQLVKILQKESQDFIDENKSAVAVLGADLVSDIFRNEILIVTPIPILPVNAGMDSIADREAIITARARMNQLIAKADLEYAVSIQKLRDSARDRAIRVGSAVLGVALGALKGIVGG